jgi:rubrerythrin
MLTRNTFNEWYIEAVRMNVKADPELREMLLAQKHPRVVKMLDHLFKEIQKACFLIYQKKKRYPLPQTVKGMVYDFTKLFMDGLENQAKRMYESDLSRIAREQELANLKDLEATDQGHAQGVFADAGVMINDQTTTFEQKTES